MNVSVFDLLHQNQSVDAKLAAALERVSEAFRVLLWEQSKQTGLSPIQIQILIFLANHSSEKRKVGYLAQEFTLTRPTISDAVKVMEQKGLLMRQPEPTDNRSHTLHLTPSGQQLAEQTGRFANAVEQTLSAFDPAQKGVLLDALTELIFRLHKQGFISIQRMCKTCHHYSYANGEHYCALLSISLEQAQLRVDCPEHEAVHFSGL